jgi:hypothetical protein
MAAVRFTEKPDFVGVQPGVMKNPGEMLVNTEQPLVSVGTDGRVGDAVGHGRKRSAEIFRVNRERTLRPVMQLDTGL